MSSNPSQAKQAPLLILSLVLIVICVLALVALALVWPVLTAPPPGPTATITPTRLPSFTPSPTLPPSLTPTLTRTPHPSLSPTISLTPTPQPPASETPTPTGLPTLTPARPLLLSDSYKLTDWLEEDADYMARLMDDYPKTLSDQQRGEDNAAYFAAFTYARLALDEALLRFPDAPQVAEWRWMLAYNLARLGDPEAGEAYADLLAGGLTRGETDLSQLYIWFHTQEPRLALYMIELKPPSGYLASYLAEIRGAGSAFIWLLQTPSGFQARPLLTNFDFVHVPQARWMIADLNRDQADGEEVAIYFTVPQDPASPDAPYVFNLAQVPPRELPFLPQESIFFLGLTFENRWVVLEDPQGGNQLAFRNSLFPPCPVEVRLAYRWNGLYFAWVDTHYELVGEPLSLGYCRLVVDHAATAWGPAAAISLMEPLLPEWPPAQDEQGQPFPLDAKDEWRFRLGVYYALLGEREQALDYLEQIVQQPVIPLSRWVEPAQTFLAEYQEPEDIYRACVTTVYCDTSYALERLIDFMPPGSNPIEYLWQSGPELSASGFFDFDGDEYPERWFTVRPRKHEKLQFWILAEYPGGLKALHVATVESNPPSLEYLDAAYIREDALHLRPYVFLESRYSFSMRRLPDTLEPYLVEVPLRVEYPNAYWEGLWSAEHALFQGVPAAQVQKKLQTLAEWPGLLCRPTWSCDSYYYLLGLASELAGDERKAVETYHRLWSDYSKSPYTTMARLKLAGAVFLSPTPSPSVTPSVTQVMLSPTPTVTGTLPTGTPTPSQTITATLSGTPPTATPTPTITPTLSGTPDTATPTPTDTLTLTPTQSPYPPP